MTPGQSYFEVSAANIHELRWRAYQAGYDQRDREQAGVPAIPLNEEFAKWCEHEAHAGLDKLQELTFGRGYE